MDWAFAGIREQSFLSPSRPPYLLAPPPPSNLQSSGFNLDNKVSPSVLLIIIILAIIFFLSGLLHLLVRFLFRPQNRNPDDLETATAFQGQLQQLFHLHDSGVDQSFIDTLPVFNYKSIIGVKDPFDCAVCLCEFEPEDKLRLLPKCSHAFHMECIDTWLLSHSTCPLCRASLLPDFSPSRSFSPIVLVLESGNDSAREIVSERDCVLGSSNSVARANSQLGFQFRDEFGSSHVELSPKSGEIRPKIEVNQERVGGSEEKVVAVKLGKFRNVGGGDGGKGEGETSSSTSNNNVDERRCFSMGSFAYIMDEKSLLQVPIKTPMKKQSSKKKASMPLTPGHRTAMSECDCDSRREFSGFEPFKSGEIQRIGYSGNISSGNGKDIGRSKRGESFSISKIWLREKKEKPHPQAAAAAEVAESSRRAFSFRFPVHRSSVTGGSEELKLKIGGGNNRRTVSEVDMRRWVNGGSELGSDEENQSRNISSDSQPKTPSFARRTLLWLVGKQNKVVHSSSLSPNF